MGLITLCALPLVNTQERLDLAAKQHMARAGGMACLSLTTGLILQVLCCVAWEGEVMDHAEVSPRIDAVHWVNKDSLKRSLCSSFLARSAPTVFDELLSNPLCCGLAVHVRLACSCCCSCAQSLNQTGPH